MTLKPRDTSILSFLRAQIVQIPVIASLTYRQVFRRKSLFFLFSLLGFFLLGEWICTSEIGGEVQQGVSMWVYVLLSSLWITAFIIMMASDLLREDWDSQAQTLWLSRPLGLGTYLAGKAIALLSIIAIFLISVFVIQVGSAFSRENSIPWEFIMYQSIMFFPYLFLLLLSFQITLKINQTFSVLASFILIIATAIIDYIVYSGTLAESKLISEANKLVILSAYWILPQLGSVFYHSNRLLEGTVNDPSSYGIFAILQVGLWILILKILLLWTNRRMEI
ncbi:ABC transporter permease [Leptospira perolatii]|uniref:ABC transporter permease n=1 Tax=Leptospira perolatii TaxID=2023191 RepID=A0A2M9ZTH6_9LEPT|nr:ABC transporter permease [Leptospira perolatii]PJZ71598.1 ABC transporter permease [Leptospira perolatii]PJZ75213.1 ABC transporter permease [Leptospira perolatii]